MMPFHSSFDEPALSLSTGGTDELLWNEKFNGLVDHSRGSSPRVDCSGGAVLEFALFSDLLPVGRLAQW